MNYKFWKKLKDLGFPFEEMKVGEIVRGSADDYIDFNLSGDKKLGAQHFYLPSFEDVFNFIKKWQVKMQ